MVSLCQSLTCSSVTPTWFHVLRVSNDERGRVTWPVLKILCLFLYLSLFPSLSSSLSLFTTFPLYGYLISLPGSHSSFLPPSLFSSLLYPFISSSHSLVFCFLLWCHYGQISYFFASYPGEFQNAYSPRLGEGLLNVKTHSGFRGGLTPRPNTRT